MHNATQGRQVPSPLKGPRVNVGLQGAQAWGEQLNTEDLFTDSNGKVVYHVKDNGEYSVIVSAPGMIAVEESSKTKCNITACDKCFTLFKY